MNMQDRLWLKRHGLYEKRFARQINRALRIIYRDVARQYRESGQFQLSGDPIERVYRSMYQFILSQEAVITWNAIRPSDRIGKKDLIDDLAETFAPEYPELLLAFWTSLMNTYLNVYIAIRLQRVDQTTRERIRAIIDEGGSMVEIAKRIEQEARKQEIRANTIARTETTNAMNRSTLIALESSGGEWEKSWVPMVDDRTRDAHIVMHNSGFIPLREQFIVGGERMNYPGDVSTGASAGNVVNCRCRLSFREVGARAGFRRVR